MVFRHRCEKEVVGHKAISIQFLKILKRNELGAVIHHKQRLLFHRLIELLRNSMPVNNVSERGHRDHELALI